MTPLEKAQVAVRRLRKAAGLPMIEWPDDDELSIKLGNEPSRCHRCDSVDINASDYDGGRELTCKVECSSCGAVWGERYCFVGAWTMDEDDEEDIDV